MTRNEGNFYIYCVHLRYLSITTDYIIGHLYSLDFNCITKAHTLPGCGITLREKYKSLVYVLDGHIDTEPCPFPHLMGVNKLPPAFPTPIMNDCSTN